MLNPTSWSESSWAAYTAAQELARIYGHTSIAPLHLAAVLFGKGGLGVALTGKAGINAEELERILQAATTGGTSSRRPSEATPANVEVPFLTAIEFCFHPACCGG